MTAALHWEIDKYRLSVLQKQKINKTQEHEVTGTSGCYKYLLIQNVTRATCMYIYLCVFFPTSFLDPRLQLSYYYHDNRTYVHVSTYSSYPEYLHLGPYKGSQCTYIWVLAAVPSALFHQNVVFVSDVATHTQIHHHVSSLQEVLLFTLLSS